MLTSQPTYFNFEYLYYQFFLFLQKIGLVALVDGQVRFVGYSYLFYLKLGLIFISVFLTFMVVDFFHRLAVIRREEQEEMLAKIAQNASAVEKKNWRWEEVEKLLSSGNESDLKLAIIEADKMLDDLLSSLGYQGESIGDKLLAVGKGDMESLDDAWEAHKYRNRIAHESGFQISQHEARMVIARYGKVFREYQYI